MRAREHERSLARWQVIVGLLILGGGLWAGLATAPAAQSQDRNFAGSLQASYLGVPTNSDARRIALDGFVTELSLKLAVDFGENVSANVKVCYGCHGFEVDMAFIDLRFADELNIRAGRFNPAFGEFPLRHDPANHKTVDKPLPYDMGRMLRLREYNMSVMPAPYVDNGVEINGTHWFGNVAQLDYAAYVVGGFRGSETDVDLDFIQSRSPGFYYIDNNSEPAFGGRVSMSLDFSLDFGMTLGASGMYGRYDPARQRSYGIVGADLYMRIGQIDLRAEYLVRRTEMFMGSDPATRFKYGPGEDGTFDDWFLKHGWYVEAVFPVIPSFELVGRWDGMRRVGNVLATSALRSKSTVIRYTAGANFNVYRSLRLKLMAEYYDFSDFDDEVALTAGLVATF